MSEDEFNRYIYPDGVPHDCDDEDSSAPSGSNIDIPPIPDFE